ncbi:MAG: cytosolic protein [Chloroflexota bacterium]
MAKQTIDFDGVWKEALEIYFEEFIAFFFQDAHAGIDWSRKPEFLDKELQQVTPESEIGNQRVDKLVKVWLKNGQEAWVLAHVEVQSQHETEFAKRVYIYNHRLFDRFDRQVASFAILGDEGPKWKPRQYTYELWGTKVDFEFPVVKLLDYRARWAELEASSNPFATVAMAHLKAQETRNDTDARKEWKWTLTRMLYEKGFSRNDIQTLYRFIDWVLRLPKALEEGFWQQVQSYEEEQKMAYVTYAERRGIEQGIEQGAKILREMLLEILAFNNSLITEQFEYIEEHLEKIAELEVLKELNSLALTDKDLAQFYVRFEEVLEETLQDAKEESQTLTEVNDDVNGYL